MEAEKGDAMGALEREVMAPAGFVPAKDRGGIKGFVGKVVTATGTEANSDAIGLDMDGWSIGIP